MQTPDGHGRLELTKFHAPSTDGGHQRAPANASGIRHIAFAVEDIDTVLARLRARRARRRAEARPATPRCRGRAHTTAAQRYRRARRRGGSEDARHRIVHPHIDAPATPPRTQASNRTCAGPGERANERGRDTACDRPRRPRWPAGVRASPCRSRRPARPVGLPAPRSARAPLDRRFAPRRGPDAQSHGRAAAARCPAPRNCYASPRDRRTSVDRDALASPSHTIPTIPSA
jgi:hypothetical protein